MQSKLFLILTVLFSACDPCKNLDCAYDDYDGAFRVVSAANGNDLVFGPQRVYSATAIQFYSITSNDTTFYQVHPGYRPGNGYDSILQVRFFPKADTVFMRLNQADVDTLHLQFQTTESRCCGTITKIKSMRLNNSVDLSGKGVQQVRK